MEAAFLAEHYRELDDDTLLRIASDRKDLTAEAAMALDAGLSTRRLGQTGIRQLAAFDRNTQKREDRINANKKFRNSLTQYFGHWNVKKKLNAEIYTATKFGPFQWFPLIPLGTYRLIRPRNYRRFYVFPRVVEKLPMDWQQVLWIWCRSLLLLFAIVLLMLRYTKV